MKLKKGGLFVLFTCFVFLFCLGKTDASSASVSPAIYEVNFEPNYEGDFVFNYEFSETFSLNVSVKSDLEDYVTLDRDFFEGSGTVNVHLKLPAQISEPGTHRIEVIASPDTSKAGRTGTVGIVPAIGGVIKVYVPYPGKYAETEFQIKDSNEGGETPFSLKIYSKGSEAINTNSRIEIFDLQNKSVDVFELGEDLVEPTDFTVIDSVIDTSAYKAGDYRAVATVKYENGEQKSEDDFKIGELFVEIIGFTQTVEKGRINPFFVEVASRWNDPIENVYGEVFIEGRDIQFLTPSLTLQGWQTGTLQGYFDTSSIEEETEQVQAKIVVHYEEKVSEKLVDVQLVKPEKGKFEINYLLVALIGVIILLVVFFAWFYFKIKKLEKKSGKKT